MKTDKELARKELLILTENLIQEKQDISLLYLQAVREYLRADAPPVKGLFGPSPETWVCSACKHIWNITPCPICWPQRNPLKPAEKLEALAAEYGITDWRDMSLVQFAERVQQKRSGVIDCVYEEEET